MDRRQFLRRGIGAAGAGALLPSAAMAAGAAVAAPATPGPSPYGPLATEPDSNGLLLPVGFTSRIIAIAGEPVGDTDYRWHLFPDGAATFDDGDGGWYYACNSEVFDFMKPASGSVSAIHFGADGSIVDAYRILEGSNSNCGGGPTPWGTWLSGEENFSEQGVMWECDPTGATPAIAREAMGRWAHEAAAVDPDDECVYLTQDHPEGLLYRFTPTAYPDLSTGTLDACIVGDDGSVTWGLVADPSGAAAPTRTQVPGARVFPGNEGIWYHDGWIYFTSKYDHSVHGIDVRAQTYTLIWKGDPDGLGVEGAVLSGVDNITVDAGSGDLIVAEDGGNMELVLITPEGQVAPFLRVVQAGHETSEMTGPVFNPRRDRLYFSSQRGPTSSSWGQIIDGMDAAAFQGGITYEISGPFRSVAVDEPESTTTTAATTTVEPVEPAASTTTSPVTTLMAAASTTSSSSSSSAAGDGSDDSGSSSAAVPIGIGVVAIAAIGGVVAVRRRARVEPDRPSRDEPGPS